MRYLPTGEERKTFWGTNRETFVTDKIILPESIDTFLLIIINTEDNLNVIEDIKIQYLKPINMYLLSGDISHIEYLLPDLRIQWY